MTLVGRAGDNDMKLEHLTPNVYLSVELLRERQGCVCLLRVKELGKEFCRSGNLWFPARADSVVRVTTFADLYVEA